MAEGSSALRHLRNIRVIIVLALAIAFSGASVFAVMSDTSVHNLTVKMFYVSRYCALDPTTDIKTVNFFTDTKAWSASSLHTSISQVRFSLSQDGVLVGSVVGNDASWDPGGGARYTLTFAGKTLDPASMPQSPRLVLILTAYVSAGLSSSTVTATDALVQNFGTTSC